MNKQRVYRSGLMTPSDAGAAHDVTLAVDARCPHPTPRMGALFATTTLPSVARWVLGNDMCRYETRVHEITVDADTTYVYNVRAWERASSGWDYPREATDAQHARYDDYWATGMTLTDWLARAEIEDLDAEDWEVLVAPGNVLSTRPVSKARFMAAAPERRRSELDHVVRAWRRPVAA